MGNMWLHISQQRRIFFLFYHFNIYLLLCVGLTDYAASVIHVYNCAPVEAFVNPRIIDARLGAYRRLLAKAFPMRLHLSSLVSLGPRILQRHMVSRQRSLRERKQQVATTVTTTAGLGEGQSNVVVLLSL